MNSKVCHSTHEFSVQRILNINICATSHTVKQFSHKNYHEQIPSSIAFKHVTHTHTCFRTVYIFMSRKKRWCFLKS